MFERNTTGLHHWEIYFRLIYSLYSMLCLPQERGTGRKVPFVLEHANLLLQPPTIFYYNHQFSSGVSWRKSLTLPMQGAWVWSLVRQPGSFLVGWAIKNSPPNAGDKASIPGSGIWPHAVGNGSPPQYSCLQNSMDRGAWQATVHGVTKSLRHD